MADDNNICCCCCTFSLSLSLSPEEEEENRRENRRESREREQRERSKEEEQDRDKSGVNCMCVRVYFRVFFFFFLLLSGEFFSSQKKIFDVWQENRKHDDARFSLSRQRERESLRCPWYFTRQQRERERALSFCASVREFLVLFLKDGRVHVKTSTSAPPQ